MNLEQNPATDRKRVFESQLSTPTNRFALPRWAPAALILAIVVGLILLFRPPPPPPPDRAWLIQAIRSAPTIHVEASRNFTVRLDDRAIYFEAPCDDPQLAARVILHFTTAEGRFLNNDFQFLEVMSAERDPDKPGQCFAYRRLPGPLTRIVFGQFDAAGEEGIYWQAQKDY